ncbi:MAG: Ig-like domain-containing protein [Candidatus Sumerlaeia bacterium]|nr:Ig-like domain-containing protein [Candidatus Sumerlaeia bacterium]
MTPHSPRQCLRAIFAAGLALVASVSSQAGSLVTPLQSPNEETNGEFGRAISGIPDVNGDGRGDFVLGARQEDPGGAIDNEGRAYVMNGFTGAVIHTLVSPTPKETGIFGVAVAAIPDVTGDGVWDVAVGASNENGTTGSPDGCGRVHLFNGATGVFIRTLRSGNESEFGRFGGSVAGIGDVNGDGFGDVLVGASGEAPGGIAGSGQAYLLSGATGAVLRTFASPTPRVSGVFGSAISPVPDVTGDGIPDVLVGASNEDPSGTIGAGRAYLYNGATGALLRTFLSPTPQANGRFGFALDGLDDFTGDGLGDVVIGSYGEDPGASPSSAGRAHLFNGATGAFVRSLASPNETSGGRFAAAVSGIADMNGDGRGDVLVGAFGEGGGSRPVTAGTVYLFSATDGVVLDTSTSPNEEAGGVFAIVVTDVPDITGDGRPEYGVGASGEDPGASPIQSGRAYIFQFADTTPPTATIAALPALTNQTFFAGISVSFSEAVTGLALGDFSTSGITLGNLQGSGDSYTVDVTLTGGDGAKSFFLPADSAFDPASNGNLQSNASSTTLDASRPTATIALLPSPTSLTSFPGVAVTFGEPVTGLDLSDFSTSGIVLSNLQGSGAAYTVDVALTGGEGPKSFTLPLDSAFDAASNGNAASNTASTTYDVSGPTATIAALPGLTNQTFFAGISVTFSEVVTGLALGDFSTSGITLGNLQGSGAAYTVDVTLTGGDGAKFFFLPASSALDAASNGNLVSNTASTTLDQSQPTVLIGALPPATSQTFFPGIAVDFSEAVTGLGLGDFTTSGVSLSNLQGSGATYTVDATLTGGAGIKTFLLPAGSAFDGAGNPNAASNTVLTTFFPSAPTVTIGSLPALTNQTSFPGIAVTFSEAVTGLALGDFSTSGITLSNLQGSGAAYTVDVTLTGGDGAKSFFLPADSAFDAATNGNLLSNTASTTLDASRPTATIAALPALTNQTFFAGVAVTFSEGVTGLALGDFSTSGITLSNLQGSGAAYTVDVTLTGGDGAKSFFLPADSAFDAATNGNLLSNTASTTLDASRPTASIAALPALTNQTSFPGIAVTFSETVTGLALGDFSTSGITLGNLQGSGAAYTVDVTLTGGDGAKSFFLPADSAFDAATNGNLLSNTASTTLDASRPTATIAALPALTNQTSFPGIAVTLSETVTGLALGDFSTSGITLGNLQGSGAAYTVDVTLTGGDGAKSFFLPADRAADAATNGNLLSNTASTTLDASRPTAIIAAMPALTNQTFFAGVSVTFSEAVTGLALGDFSTSGITLANLQGSGAAYTVDVTLTGGDGAKSFFLPADSAFDAATNGNLQSNTASTTLQTTQPTVLIAALPATTNQTFFDNLSITFSEPVTGLALGDFLSSGITVSDLQGGGANYTVDATITGGDGAKSFSLPAGVAQSASLAPNVASNTVTTTYDATGSTATIAALPALTNQTFFAGVSVTFSEAVTGLALGDFSTSGITLSNLQGSGAAYTVDVTLTGGDGAKSFFLPADRAADAATNGNLQSNTASTTLDASRPTVAFGALPPATNQTSFNDVTVSFSEPVAGLALGDFSVSGVSLSDLQGSGAAYTVDVTLTGGDGAKSFSLPQDRATDAAGNGNAASAVVAITLDRVAPTAVIGAIPSATNQTSFPGVAVTFSEPVTGLALGDFTASGITLSNLQGSGAAYTVDVTLTGGDGAKSLVLPAGSAADAAGNGNAVSNTRLTTLDRVAPASSVIVANVTQAGVPITAAYTASDAGGVGIAQVQLFAKREGQGYALVGTATGGTISYTPSDLSESGDGLYRFAVVATDFAGNTESFPIEPDVRIGSVFVNLTENSPFVFDLAGNGTAIFPMTDDIDVLLTATNLFQNATLTVSRGVGDASPSPAFGADRLADEFLTISGETFGATFELEWPLDPANDDGLATPFDTVFQFDGQTQVGQYAVTPGAIPVVAAGIGSFSTFWVGNNNATVEDWSLFDR